MSIRTGPCGPVHAEQKLIGLQGRSRLPWKLRQGPLNCHGQAILSRSTCNTLRWAIFKPSGLSAGFSGWWPFPL